MIELIFAIVVIGITLLSIPNLLIQSSKSSLVTLQQEAIAMAASHTNALMTYAWDQNNTDEVGSYINNKLYVNAGDSRLEEANIATNLLFPNARKRKFHTTDHPWANPIGKEGTSNNDVDDFNGVTSHTTTITGGNFAANQGEYVDINISQSTTVSYGTDTASYNSATGVFSFSNPWSLATPAGTTNIKLIETNLISNSTTTELQKNIKLRAFMCNIGAHNPLSKGNI
jgi:type II secretory pathway pseudopilin PulG